MSVFEVLRDQVPLAEVVGRFSEVKSGKVRCIVPDHLDQDPSMRVYEDHVHCYACRFHGDVVDVWAAGNGLVAGDEAARDLAREYRVELPEWSPEERERFERRRGLEERYLRQAEVCHRALADHTHVRDWWEGRGFDADTRQQFLLGTNRDGTEAVIPFWNSGRAHGLIRRKLRGLPKYLYPRAEEFAAGYRPLFAPGPFRDGALVVEGPVDALAAAVVGESVAAVGGTGVSPRQLAELERLPGIVYLLSRR